MNEGALVPSARKRGREDSGDELALVGSSKRQEVPRTSSLEAPTMLLSGEEALSFFSPAATIRATLSVCSRMCRNLGGASDCCTCRRTTQGTLMP